MFGAVCGGSGSEGEPAKIGIVPISSKIRIPRSCCDDSSPVIRYEKLFIVFSKDGIAPDAGIFKRRTVSSSGLKLTNDRKAIFKRCGLFPEPLLHVSFRVSAEPQCGYASFAYSRRSAKVDPLYVPPDSLSYAKLQRQWLYVVNHHVRSLISHEIVSREINSLLGFPYGIIGGLGILGDLGGLLLDLFAELPNSEKQDS